MRSARGTGSTIGPHLARVAGCTMYVDNVPPGQTQSYPPSTHRLPRDSALGVSLSTYGTIRSSSAQRYRGIPLSARDSPLAVAIVSGLIGIIRDRSSLMSLLEIISQDVPESMSHVSTQIGKPCAGMRVGIAWTGRSAIGKAPAGGSAASNSSSRCRSGTL